MSTRAKSAPTREIKVTLVGKDYKELDRLCEMIKSKALSAGLKVRGPIRLPTKRLIVTVRKSPDGEGTETVDHWEMRIHKRLLYVQAEERIIKEIVRINYPAGVEVELKIIERGGR